MKGLPLGAFPTRAQLICLPRYLSEGPLAASVANTWAALTQACHHHPYELPPTIGELRRWLEITQRFIEQGRS
jgi:hypothetical protein